MKKREKGRTPTHSMTSSTERDIVQLVSCIPREQKNKSRESRGAEGDVLNLTKNKDPKADPRDDKIYIPEGEEFGQNSIKLNSLLRSGDTLLSLSVALGYY